MNTLKDKIAIITGAGSNMGEAAAVLFAQEGAEVVVADYDAKTGAAVASRIGASFVHADISKSSEVDALVQGVIEKFGRIDVIYNNAGISRVTPVVDATDEEFDLLMRTNIGGVFYGTRAAGKAMKLQGSGIIINTASTNAVQGVAGMSLYSATKAAVVALTKVAAAELAPFGIRVNAICPGIIPSANLARQMGMTEQQLAQLDAKQPVGRVGKPEEIALAALFLASDQSSFITGHALVVDGGLTSCGAMKL